MDAQLTIRFTFQIYKDLAHFGELIVVKTFGSQLLFVGLHLSQKTKLRRLHITFSLIKQLEEECFPIPN